MSERMTANIMSCPHGLDMRIHPRCYLCEPRGDETTITESPEEDGSLDDLFIRGGIESFHIERMDEGVWWFAVYFTDRSRHTFNLHSKKRIDAEHYQEPSLSDLGVVTESSVVDAGARLDYLLSTVGE